MLHGVLVISRVGIVVVRGDEGGWRSPVRLFVVVTAFLVFGVLSTAVADATSEVTTQRIAGANRYATSVMLRDAADATQCGDCPVFGAPILASGETFADALGAANDAVEPILLTTRDVLPSETRSALQKYASGGDKPVIIAGGTAAVSTAVEDEVKSLGLTPERVAGSDRYDTAARFALGGGPVTTILVASGEAFADALAVGPVVGSSEVARGYTHRLVLTPHDHLAPAAQLVIKQNPGASVMIVGGESAVSSQVASEIGAQYRGRIAGIDRYATAAKVADYLNQVRAMTQQAPAAEVTLAGGLSFPDALSAVALTSRRGGVILLAGPSSLPVSTHDWIATHNSDVSSITAVGGPSVVSDQALQQAGAAATT